MVVRNIQLVIFDLDGTLVDAYDAVAASLQHALEQMDLPTINHAMVKKNVGWGETHLISKLVPQTHVAQVLSIYRQHHRSALKSGTKFLPGAKKLLEGLKKDGYTLAVATNRTSRFTHVILKHLKIADSFDYIVCGDEVKRAKPEPDMLQMILKRSGIRVEQVVYVGDMMIDVQAGVAAGIKTIAVLTGSCGKEDFSGHAPFAFALSADQILPILTKLG